MSRLALAALAAAALALLLFLLLSLGGPSSYEANYTLAGYVEGSGVPRVQVMSGWLLLGVGRERYAAARLAVGPAAVTQYWATEGGRNYTATCLGSLCIRSAPPLAVMLNLSSLRLEQAGPCSGAGRQGRLYRAEPPRGALESTAEVAGIRIRVVDRPLLQICASGNLVLWLNYTATVQLQASLPPIAVTTPLQLRYSLRAEAASIGPYNATRYQRILGLVKGP